MEITIEHGHEEEQIKKGGTAQDSKENDLLQFDGSHVFTGLWGQDESLVGGWRPWRLRQELSCENGPSRMCCIGTY